MTKESLFCRAANCVLASKSHLPRLALPAFMLFPVYLTAFSPFDHTINFEWL